jgi:hypothetical protein
MLANDELVEDDPHGFSAGYKLVLQSVVCHRGDSLQSGHYIAFARVDPKLLTDNRRHDYDPPPDYEEAQWVKFDDLMIESRVSYVDDIKESLRSEMPYLLFYQIVPNVDIATYSTDETGTEPPSYSASKVDLNASPTPVVVEQFSKHHAGSGWAEGYFGSTPTPKPAKAPSIRLSSDYGMGTTGRPSSEMPSSSAGGSASGSRPQSMAVGTEVSVDETPATTITSESHSPVVSPNDETTAQRLSRAAARVRNVTKSRPQSQVGEGRLSSTMKQIGGLMRTSKEPLREVPPMTAASLHTSTSAPPTVPPSEHSEDGQAGEPGEAKTHSHHHHHLRHRKGKSKQGEKKEKPGDTDRECTVM